MKRWVASLPVTCETWQVMHLTFTVSCSRIAWYDVLARPSVVASAANVESSVESTARVGSEAFRAAADLRIGV